MIILLFVLLAQLIYTNAAAAINCKAIDSTKFKESFDFKYSGGAIGLELKFPFEGKSDRKFIHQGCKFEIKELKTSIFGVNGYKPQTSKFKNLNSLTACTKYKVTFTLINLSSKAQFEYQTFVTTKPDKTTNIQLSVENVTDSTADLKWTTNSKGCLLNYGIIVKNMRNQIIQNITSVTANSYSLSDLSEYVELSAEITGYDDKNSKIKSNTTSFKLMSNELDNDYLDDLEISLSAVKIDTQSVELKWNCSDAELQDLVYHLVIHDSLGKSVYDKNISNDNSVLVNRLEACNDYTASVTVLSQTKSIDFTTKSLKPGNVTNFTFNSNETHSILTWKHPKEHHNCVTSYTIDYKGSFDDLISSSWIVSKNSTTLVVDKLPYVKRITFRVYANWSTSDEDNISLLTNSFEYFDQNEFVVENFREFRLSATEVQVLWSFNSSYAKIFKKFVVTLDGETRNMTNKFINFEIDACAEKNYTITIKCISKDGNAGREVTYQTHLNDDDVQLSAINDTDIKVEQTDAAITIAWKPNPRERLCITHYEVEYSNNVSIYEQPRMEIHKFSPCVTYQIGITPVSKNGRRGAERVFEFDTNVKAPPKPSQLKLTYRGNQYLMLAVSIDEEFKRCVLMKPTVIEISCNNNQISVKENITKIQTDYKVSVKNLKANTQYKCSVKVKNDIGESESSDEAEFMTEQDSPQPPNNIKTHINENNSVDITWKSNNSTGFADYFKAHLTLVKTLYEIGENCQMNLKNLTIIESSLEEATAKNLLPYSKYKLRLQASNKHGNSNFSVQHEFITLPTKPTQPRDIEISFENDENSKLSAIISWKSPCHMNGAFNLYTITLNGHRKGLIDHKDAKASSIPEIKIDDLKMGYKYELEIQAVNQNEVAGDVLKHSFISPSGIPLAEDLKDWTTLGRNDEKFSPENVDIWMKRQVFVSSVGDIKGIIFLVFARNCHDLPQPLFGYRKNSNIELPQATINELNCSQLYQQTDFLKNPLNYDDEIELNDFENFNTKFTLGEGKCGKHTFTQSRSCNGALRPNENYGLIARVFTKDAFRDTEPVYFDTSNNYYIALLYTEYAIPVVVIGCVIIAVLISLVTGIVCCWMTRRQKRIEKEKETAEAAENLFSFTSYCVVDKNPFPKTQFDPLL